MHSPLPGIPILRLASLYETSEADQELIGEAKKSVFPYGANKG